METESEETNNVFFYIHKNLLPSSLGVHINIDQYKVATTLYALYISVTYTLCVCVLQSGAGELDPQRRSGESDLQGAPASLLSGEGGFQQGQSFTQTHGAGERAQHQAVDPSLSPPSATLTTTLPQ